MLTRARCRAASGVVGAGRRAKGYASAFWGVLLVRSGNGGRQGEEHTKELGDDSALDYDFIIVFESRDQTALLIERCISY
jgi:hypothetical protein